MYCTIFIIFLKFLIITLFANSKGCLNLNFSTFLDKITDLDPNSFISKNQVKVHQLFFCTVMKDDVELKREGKVHILM